MGERGCAGEGEGEMGEERGGIAYFFLFII